MDKKAFNLVMGKLSQMGQPSSPVVRREPTQQEIDNLFAERITPTTDLPPMQPLFRMFDEACFYRSELVAICGKAKSGKTTFLSVLMAACLTQKALALERHPEVSDEPSDILSPPVITPLKVLWIDTEQSQQSTQEILRDRIMPLARIRDEDCITQVDDHLYAFNLRGFGYENRGKMVDVALRTVKPDIAVIDGIKDLMTDINDAVQATLLMEKLMALAKETNCCIVCVLHLNKSDQDRNMRGSIGTELTNKAFEVFQCEMPDDSGTFKVSHTYSRKRKMKRKLYYRLNDDGLPEMCDDYEEQPRDRQGRWVSREASQMTSDELQKLFAKAMEGRTQRPFGELMAIALKKCGVVDAKAYYTLLAQAEEQGIIRKLVHPETNVTWVELDENQLPF